MDRKSVLVWVVLAIIGNGRTDGKVILLNDADVTTRGKTFQMLCRTEGEDLDGWYDKQGRKIDSEAIFDKFYIQKIKRGPNAQTLYIQNVKVADGGNYTCKGTKSSKNFELYVEFYTVQFPSSIKLNASQSAMIPCSGIGYPPPTYRWYTNWLRDEIKNRPRFKIMSNGSLFIQNATVKDASNYTCRIIQLEQSLRAREERKNIEVVVYGPPILNKTVSTMQPIYSYKGNKRIKIVCKWLGFPIPKMSITRPHNRGLLTDITESGRTIYGNILTEDEDDFGEYICKASNFLGRRQHSVVVKEADQPLAPTNLSSFSHCGYLTVVWSIPTFDGGLPITLYEIELLQAGISKDDAFTGVKKPRYTFNGGTVQPATQYTVRVRGRNHAKDGQWATLDITSDICPPSGKIEITNRKTLLNTTRFTLTWTGPENDGGDPGTNYVIEYSKMDKDGKYVHWTTIKDVSGYQYNITGLDRGSKYMFHVIAKNSRGRSKPGRKEFEISDDEKKMATTSPPPSTQSIVDLVYDIKVNCTSMAIQVDLTLQKLANTKLELFQLRDPSCTPVEQTDRYVTLRTRLDGCDTTSKHQNETVTYYNSVTARVVQSESKLHIVEFPFSCTFVKRRRIGTPSFQLTKRVSVVNEGFGNFSFEMNLFKTSLFKYPFDVSDYPVSVPITKKLFAQTRLLSSDKNLEALTYTCIATPSTDPNDELQYLFIENGCVLDETVKFKPVPGVTQNFQMLPFRFKDKSNSIVYLHCHVLVCHRDDLQSRCRKGCIPKVRSARDVTRSRRSSLHRVTLGPIQVGSGTRSEKLTVHKESGLSLGLLLVAIFGTLIVSLIIFATVAYGLHYAIITQGAAASPENEPLEMSRTT